MVDAIPALTSPVSIELFRRFGVFTESELRSRAEIKYELYAKAIHIESRTMIDMASKSIIPAVIHWTRNLADSVTAVRQAGVEPEVQLALLAESNELLTRTKLALQELSDLTEKAEEQPEGRDRAVFYHEHIMPAMEALRTPVDRLEMIVDKDMWPMPSYGDLLFEI